MSDVDRDYYRRRASEELNAAKLANAPEIASIHRILAARYSALGGEGSEDLVRQGASASEE
jgi:hypothetical protein